MRMCKYFDLVDQMSLVNKVIIENMKNDRLILKVCCTNQLNQERRCLLFDIIIDQTANE